MTAKRSWYLIRTEKSKPYPAIGPFTSYYQADNFGGVEFKTYSLVKITRRLACSRYRTKTTERYRNE